GDPDEVTAALDERGGPARCGARRGGVSEGDDHQQDEGGTPTNHALHHAALLSIRRDAATRSPALVRGPAFPPAEAAVCAGVAGCLHAYESRTGEPSIPGIWGWRATAARCDGRPERSRAAPGRDASAAAAQ